MDKITQSIVNININNNRHKHCKIRNFFSLKFSVAVIVWELVVKETRVFDPLFNCFVFVLWFHVAATVGHCLADI